MNNQNGIKGMRMLQQLVIAAAMVLASVASHAQTTIDAVTGSTSGGTEVVRIDLSQPLTAAPTGFSIQSPARIALDFPGISNGMGRSTIDINQGNLKSVSVVQAGDRTRVVLNLKQATTYKTQIQGKSLLVVLDASISSTPAAAAAPSVFAENKNRDTLPLKDLDFRRWRCRRHGRAPPGPSPARASSAPVPGTWRPPRCPARPCATTPRRRSARR